MNDWYSFYQNRLNSKYIEHLENKYDYFLSSIENFVLDNKDKSICIVEIGAGCSNISKILYDRLKQELTYMPKFIAVEKDKKMYELSFQNINHRNITLIKCNALDLNDKWFPSKSDLTLIISHGLLEHFGDYEINKILNLKHPHHNTKHLHYVPSYKYETPSFGDERLLTKVQWSDILSEIKEVKIEQFNNGYDYLIKADSKE